MMNMDDDFVLVDEKTPEVTEAKPKARKPKATKAKVAPEAKPKATKAKVAPEAKPKATKATKAKVAPEAKVVPEAKPKATKAKVAPKAKPKAGKAKPAPKTKPKVKAAKVTRNAAIKPANPDTLTRSRSRQRLGRVAAGMTRAGDMAQVTLTFPPKQLNAMRAFASRGKVSLSEAARQLVAMGLKA